MKDAHPDAILSNLDLTNPRDIAIAFHYVQHWPEENPIIPETFGPLFDIVELHGHTIFGQPDNEYTSLCVANFLWLLGGIKIVNSSTGMIAARARREWLAVFRAAHQRGIIGPVALGAAFAFLVTLVSGNGAPGYSPASVDAKRIMLADARNSSPIGLMDEIEREHLAKLSDTLTIFRGGCCDIGATPLANAQALHWATTFEYAASYFIVRSQQRALSALKGAILGMPSAFAFDSPTTKLSSRAGAPFLLRATIPKEFVLAYMERGPDRTTRQFIIDFERLEPEMIDDLTPTQTLAAIAA